MPSKNFFSLCTYKIIQISREGYKKCDVEIIYKERYFWVNRKDLEVQPDVANQSQIFDKCDSEKQKDRQELTPNAEYQLCRVFVRNDLVERKIKSCRKSSKRFLELKKKLGLDPDVNTCDERDVISALQVAFEGKIILTQHCIKNSTIEAYFSKYKLGTEVDEYNHKSRNSEYEQSRKLMIESHGITIIRTNPDAGDFDMNRLINQIYTHIIESTKKQTKTSTKKSLIADLSKRLLELEFKSNHLIKKCLKRVVKIILPN